MSQFCPLFSSSSGNCTYISCSDGSILIDAGVSAKRICEALNGIGADISSVKAVFVTHEHSDHISGLRVLASRYKIPVFTSAGTLSYLEEKCMANSSYRAYAIGSDGIEIAGMHVRPICTSHDTRESVCYTVTLPHGRKAAVVTDLGCMNSQILDSIRGCNLVMLESNHDVRMLQSGKYPYYLKRRILSDRGHLSNDACASALTELIQTGSTQFILGHLSRENNIPQLAFETSFAALSETGAELGKDYLLKVAAPSGNQVVRL